MIDQGKENGMIGWTLTHAIVSLFAAAFGFSGIGDPAATIGKIIFVIFLTLFALSALLRAMRGKPPV